MSQLLQASDRKVENDFCVNGKFMETLKAAAKTSRNYSRLKPKQSVFGMCEIRLWVVAGGNYVKFVSRMSQCESLCPKGCWYGGWLGPFTLNIQKQLNLGSWVSKVSVKVHCLIFTKALVDKTIKNFSEHVVESWELIYCMYCQRE